MIILKNKNQLNGIRVACKLTGEVLAYAGEHVREGISTKYLDDLIRRFLEKEGATPTFLGYGGFPGCACISVNNEVIHGIPSSEKILKEGDIVKIDVGATKNGFNGDSANTFAVGKISDSAQKLIEATRNSFHLAVNKIAELGDQARVGDIGCTVETYAKECGYSVVRKFVGHGTGTSLHEQPDIPNFGRAGRGVRLTCGMTIAIEPMINMGTADVRVLPNQWTVVTVDGALSAHYEHTVAITENGPEILTSV